MATSILYLDVDDEITSAAARVRSADARRVAVVLPYGSRVATSRINFRLLARDAMSHEKRLSVVSGDPATRALAASAGLPVFNSVGEYEASEEGDGGIAGSSTVAGGAATAAAATAAGGPDTRDQDASRAAEAAVLGSAAIGAAAASAAGPASGTASGTGLRPPVPDVDTSAVTVEGVVPIGAAAPATPRAASSGGASVVRPERVTRGGGRDFARTPIIVGLAVIALAVVVSGVAAYLFLPSATIAITPREETIGPVSFRVTADPTATTPDVDAGVVPATVIDLPQSMSDTFPATGKRVEEEKARGSVRFDNLDFTSSNTIPKGSVVSTGSGIRFRTDRAVRVPAAELVGLTVIPSRATVKVTAVDAGPEGNVEPNSITNVPRGEEPLFLKVTNPDATSGGSRTEFARVTQEDVDKATTVLTAGITGSFNDQLADPDLGGGDVTVFPDTGVLGETTWSTKPDDLVGQEVESFELGATATGTVTAVDTAPVQAIAEERLVSSVQPGFDLLPDSGVIDVSPGVVQGGGVSFPVTVTAKQVARLDPTAIEAELLGLPLDDAQTAADAYGTAEIDLWPDWVGSIPTFDGRVQVTVDSPIPGETPEPSEEAP